ncbi:DUF4913 domain-containing protein [Nocardia sp. NPDC052001]|uniref:DUF4913 domain-containing protein n=1 Tax=Nocardia sp. NPDC052001 TaxID=3154853 RepID=UPI0034291401
MTETVNNSHTDEAAEMVAEQVIPDMDLGALLEGAIRKAVGAQIQAQAKEIADGVVADMLTPEVIAGMRETAIHEAEIALNPPVELEEEPEPEEEEAAEEEEQEQPRELRYPTLKDFVESYVINVYRREVSKRGSERSLRWCPCWWDHGEAVARFRAMWAAFEHLRLGDGTEMNLWWLVHFDPQMDRILDPEGMFKYCSVESGCHANDIVNELIKLPPLPVVPADPALFEEENDDQEPVAASRIVLPAAPVGIRRTVPGSWEEFPG